MEENLQREKKVRADVEKAKRKVESDLKMTQEAVEELEKVKGELEANVRKSVRFILHLIVHYMNIICLFSRNRSLPIGNLWLFKSRGGRLRRYED